MFCFEKYKLLAKTPYNFAKTAILQALTNGAETFFLNLVNPPPPFPIASYVNARQKIMQVSIGVNSFPPPTAKNIHISYL